MNKILLTMVLIAVGAGSRAQQGKVLTVKDYEHAESFMIYNTMPLVDGSAVKPNWLNGDRFWYKDQTAQGIQFMLVDPAKGTRTPVFDHQKLAAALNKVTGNKVEANDLPFRSINVSADGRYVTFYANDKGWKADLQSYTLTNDDAVKHSPATGAEAGRRKAGSEVLSPDGKQAAFIKDHNLWVRNVASGKRTQLTTDGVKDFGYATDNAGWSHSNNPVLQWSPDSKKIATFKQDQRKVKDMYLVTTNVGAPVLHQWKYPLPGEEIAMIHRCIIEVDNPKVIMLKVAPDPHRATLSDDISSSGTFDDVNWTADGLQLAFVSTSRDHKQEKVRIADAATGAVREVFEETVPTQYESGWGSINWRYLAKSNEFIWFSERDNWGHLYLYDAKTGKLKNQITKGDWVVTRLLKVDEKARVVYFMAGGKEPGNPYYSHLYKIGFDGKGLVSLTPDVGTHQVVFAPSDKYIIDTYSQPNVAPVTTLRSANTGKLITQLAKTEVTRLQATGWKPPMPFSVKAADGKTDVYGLMFTPTKLDASKKYPVIDYIYPGPQGGSVGSWAFMPSRGDHQALAELGFIVVLIEGTSNPLRSKSYHDMSYGNMADNTLPDQISGIKQLAQKYAYMDLDKVGIWGHSGGGFATASAMFKYPDFFKVGISESGNHDNRNYEDDWGERYNGLLKVENGVSNYENQANQNFAKNLKGKLMLAHGMMDDNVPPYNTLLVVEALEKAGKDYDLVIFPNSAHGYGQYGPYMMRRRWDYFVRHLMGAEPPKEYQLKGAR